MAKTALVTGANKGIGFEIARLLGEQGYRVWLGARDEQRGEAAAQILRDHGHDVLFLRIAVDDDAGVVAAARRMAETDGSLDLLINNAGIPGNYADRLSQDLDNMRRVYATNVFGAIAVIQAFLPLLKTAGTAQIINVSSGLGSLAWMSDSNNAFYGANLLGYNSSKTALNAVTVSLAKALVPFGIRVNSVNPGYAKTDFTNGQGFRTAAEAAGTIVALATSHDDRLTGSFVGDDGTLPW